MKCPKDLNTSTYQQTLAQMWFGKKRSCSEANIDSDLNEYNQAKKFKSPKKTSPLKSTNDLVSNLPSTNISQITETENNSDDDIIQSSQDTRKSNLRNKIDKTVARKSVTPLSTPRKSSQLLDSPSKLSSFSQVFESSSTVIKEEIVELINDMQDFESIEMTHNLSDLLADSTTSLNLDCTSPMNHIVKLESLSENEALNPEELKDPLQIDEKIEQVQRKKPKLVAKKKRTVVAKKIGKNKLKHILPAPKKSLSKKNSYKTMDKSKSISKNSKTQSNKTEMKTDSLSNELLEVLKTLKVQLQHEVPPQHMIETSAGARNLDPEQTFEFEKYGPLKKGSFSKDEDEIIKKNWETFCNVHHWDNDNVEPFLFMRHQGKYYIPAIEERRKFVRFLANGLPWRSLYSVYYRFRNVYNTLVHNGVYTPKEDKKILSYMSKASSASDNTWAELGKLLHRKRQSIWTRYQKLKVNYNLTDASGKQKKVEKKSPSKKKAKSDKIHVYKEAPKIFVNVKWTCPLVKKFIDSILESTACNELMDLKDEKINEVVWRKMERKMCIDRTVLQNFWYLQLHMQLFCPTPIYLNDTKVKLIEYMYAENLENLEDVDWESISAHFNGITPSFLSKLFEQLLNCARKNVQISDLRDALEYLHKNYMPMLIEKSIDAILPKLFYHNGKIICIDKGSEKKVPNKFTTNPFCDEDEM